MKRLILFLTILVVGISHAYAYDFSAVAPSGQTLYYNFTSGYNAKVTFQTGSPAYSNLTGALVIPASVTCAGTTYSVTSIGYAAFYGCSGLTSVTIPSSVTSIGYDAFKNCSGLTSVTIPSSVTSIGAEAFAGCIGLTSVTIGNSVTSIEESAFAGCSGLTSVTIPSSVTSIGAEAFSGCSGLTSVTIPSSVTSIGGYAFYDCSGLTSVTIPSSVTSIGGYAFYDCSGLTSVTIPSSVTSIESGTFGDCSGLTSVTIPNSVTTIMDHAFYGCSGLTSVTIPSSVTTIMDYAFYGCSGLTSVTIPSSVTSIGYDAFYGCSGLTSVEYTGDIAGWCSIDFVNYYANPNYYAHNLTIGGSPVAGTLVIPSGVSAIKNYAFYNCSGLTSVTIPNSVTTIGFQALYGVRLVSYCGSATGSPWGATRVGCFYEDGDFYYEDAQKTTIIVYIGAGTSVTIPSSVTSIGGGAFYNCSGLTNVVFNAQNCTTMGSRYESVFSGCSNFASLTIGDSVRTIPAYAFSGCSGLTNVTIGNSVTSIGNSAFSGCSGLTSVTIPSSVTSIGSYAFSDCSGLTSVSIPSSVTSIGGYAFYDCSGLTSVTIPSSMTSIGEAAFWGCSGLTSVTIPSSVTSIESGTFGDCSGLTSVTIPSSVTSIGGSAFAYCSGLTSVTIPSSVTSIGESAFSGCIGLTSVTIPSSVTSIGSGAFYGCSGLTEITAEGVTAPLLGEYAFSGVNSTIPVYIPCGRMLSYMSRWSYFSNFVEGAGYSFDATSSNPAMGYVVVLTQPTCTAPQAVVNAVAIPGYRFDHWSNGSTANPYSFNLSQNTSLVAYFAEAVRDTVFIHDTTFVDNYIHDTTIVNNYIHDTTFVDNYIHDTTIVNNYVHDTTFIDVFIHDTTVLTEWIYDTTYVDLWHYDTIVVQQELTYYNISVLSENNARGLVAGNGRFPDGTEIEIAAIPIEGSQFLQWDDGNSDNPRTVTVSSDLTFVATFDAATQSVIDVEAVKHTVNVSGLQIIVNNAAGNQIRIFDEIGRCLSTTNSLEQVRVFNMPASGVYMVQVGSYPAQKVVVVR